MTFLGQTHIQRKIIFFSLLYFDRSVHWLRIWCCVEEVEDQAHITGVLVKFWSQNTALKPSLPLKGFGSEEVL